MVLGSSFTLQYEEHLKIERERLHEERKRAETDRQRTLTDRAEEPFILSRWVFHAAHCLSPLVIPSVTQRHTVVDVLVLLLRKWYTSFRLPVLVKLGL